MTYVVRSNGSMSIINGSANIVTVPELYNSNTIHIFDARAVASRQPVDSAAFIIVTSFRNRRSYAHTCRRNGVYMCCIPSYTLDELLQHCGLFGVSSDVILERYMKIGPFIRYVLTNASYYEESLSSTEDVAKKVDLKQLYSYLASSNEVGVNTDISPCLMIAIVHEEDFDNPEDAYFDKNSTWKFASKYLAKVVADNTSSSAKLFILNFITEINRQGMTKMKGCAGTFWEVVIDDFLVAGNFKTCRLLSDVGYENNNRSMKLWDNLTLLNLSLNNVMSALQKCGDEMTLYSFCNSFPAVDYSAQDFRIIFKVALSSTHTIELDAIRAICNHVRSKYGESEKVKLMFVVPEDVGTTGWKNTQSFKYKGEHGVVQSKYEQLPNDIKMELRNLEQWVIVYN